MERGRRFTFKNAVPEITTYFRIDIKFLTRGEQGWVWRPTQTTAPTLEEAKRRLADDGDFPKRSTYRIVMVIEEVVA